MAFVRLGAFVLAFLVALLVGGVVGGLTGDYGVAATLTTIGCFILGCWIAGQVIEGIELGLAQSDTDLDQSKPAKKEQVIATLARLKNESWICPNIASLGGNSAQAERLGVFPEIQNVNFSDVAHKLIDAVLDLIETQPEIKLAKDADWIAWSLVNGAAIAMLEAPDSLRDKTGALFIGLKIEEEHPEIFDD